MPSIFLRVPAISHESRCRAQGSHVVNILSSSTLTYLDSVLLNAKVFVYYGTWTFGGNVNAR